MKRGTVSEPIAIPYGSYHPSAFEGDQNFSEDAARLLSAWAGKLSPRDLAAGLGHALRESFQERPRQAALSAGMLRGLAAREELKAAEGGCISADQARRFLADVSKTTILDHYRKGKVLAFKEGRAFRFPVWQFAEGGGLLPGFGAVLEILHCSPFLSDWGRVNFFLTPRESLEGKRPLDLLRTGKPKPVIGAAHADVA